MTVRFHINAERYDGVPLRHRYKRRSRLIDFRHFLDLNRYQVGKGTVIANIAVMRDKLVC